MIWSSRRDKLKGGRGERFVLLRDSCTANFADVLNGWEIDGEFRSFFNNTLASLEFASFRWETPPVRLGTIRRPFEFVVYDSPGLASRPDPHAFADHFQRAAGAEILTFSNLGRDAIMVVPCPIAAPFVYGHLATFVRDAPESQRDALWQRVGETMSQRISERPVWLSTAGAGVSWLHVRLDDRPKYYGHKLYLAVPD